MKRAPLHMKCGAIRPFRFTIHMNRPAICLFGETKHMNLARNHMKRRAFHMNRASIHTFHSTIPMNRGAICLFRGTKQIIRPTNHMKRLALHMKREEPHAGRIRPYTAQNLAFTVAGMNKQSSDARIAVRIPKESDLKERLVATSKGTGIPEAVLMLRAVEALVAYYYEDSGHLRLPLEVRPQEQTEIYNLQ